MPRARRRLSLAEARLLLQCGEYDALLERDWQALVRDEAEAQGWTVFCTWNSKYSPAGEPDLRMARPPRYMAVELKTEKGRLTPAQRHALALLEECTGVEIYVWRPSQWEAVIEILR